MIYHPLCSELVAKVRVRSLKEVRETLKKVVEITGCSIVALGHTYKLSRRPLSFREFQLTSVVEPVEVDSLVIEEDLIAIPESALHSKALLNALYPKGTAGLFSAYLYDKRTGAHLKIDMEDGLSFQAEHHATTRDFPILAKILRSLNSYWLTEGGGSPMFFEKWCERHNYKDVLKKGV